MGCKSLLIIFAICLGCSSSRAQPGPTAQDREACGADVEKLCTGSTPKPGDETVLNCLVAHKSELSDVWASTFLLQTSDNSLLCATKQFNTVSSPGLGVEPVQSFSTSAPQASRS